MRYSIGILAVLGALALAAPAHAQATRTWVSGVGDDANPCSRTAPCKTFAGAISKTAASGIINCLDPGGYGTVTITKSITISCEAGTAGVLASSTTGVIVNAAATDTVVLKGLAIEGSPVTLPGINGIRIMQAAYVHIEDAVIEFFRGASPNGAGIMVNPTSGNVKFAVKRSSIIGNGDFANNTGGGIVVRPSGGATASGLIDDVLVDGNVFGIVADGNSGAGGINLTVNRSAVNAHSASAIIATTNAAGAGIMVSETAVTNNATGLNATGGAAIMRVGLSRITGNNVAVSGTVQSYGTNQLNGNNVDGTFIAVPGGLK